MRRMVCALALGRLAAGCGGATTGREPRPRRRTADAATPAPSGGGGSTIAIAADPSGALKFDKTTLTAKAGKVTIDFDNPSAASRTRSRWRASAPSTVTQGKAAAS